MKGVITSYSIHYTKLYEIRDAGLDPEIVLYLQNTPDAAAILDVVPLHVLTTVAHNGGLVLGAFDGQRLVGFSWGFLATSYNFV